MNTTTEWHEVDGEGALMSIFVAQPQEPGKYPGVLVCHHAPGINEQLQSMMERVAAEGFVCAAPDLYYRWGKRMLFQPTAAQAAIEQAQAIVGAYSDFDLAQDLRLTINFTKSLHNVIPDRIGCLGYCWGGHHAFLGACLNSDLKAVVVCYGSNVAINEPSIQRPLRPLDLAERIRCPILSLSGEQDPNPSPEHINTIAETMKELGKEFEYHIFPGAAHAFFSEDNPRRYHAPSAEKGWPLKLEFLKRHLQGPATTTKG